MKCFEIKNIKSIKENIEKKLTVNMKCFEIMLECYIQEI